MEQTPSSQLRLFPASAWLWLIGLGLPGLALTAAFGLDPGVPPAWLYVGGALMSAGMIMFLALARIWRLRVTWIFCVMWFLGVAMALMHIVGIILIKAHDWKLGLKMADMLQSAGGSLWAFFLAIEYLPPDWRLPPAFLFVVENLFNFLSIAPVMGALLAITVCVNRQPARRWTDAATFVLVLGAFLLALILPSFTAKVFVPAQRPIVVPPALEADTADGREPPFSDAPKFWSERNLGKHFRLRTNLTPAVFGIDLFPQADTSQPWTTRLYPSFAAALRAAEANPETPVLPSFAMLNQKAKNLGDDLLAAVERNLTRHPLAPGGGKNVFLGALAQAALKADDGSSAAREVIAYLAAAAELGGEPRLALPPDAAARRDTEVAEFAESRRAKPIGFYGGDDPVLAAVFQRDRFLQLALSDDAAIRLAQVLMSEPALRTAYEQWLAVGTCLTNPPARITVADLFGREALTVDRKKLFQELRATPNGRRAAQFPEDTTRGRIRLLPEAMSVENALFARLFGFRTSLPAEDIMSVLVRELRDGTVSLAPQPDSGFYDWQCFAIEPLIRPEAVPEAAKIVLGKKYKEIRLEAFKAALTKAREMQVKAIVDFMGLGVPDLPPKPLAPELRLEPVATAYLRTAQALAWLDAELTRILEPGLFKAIQVRGQPASDALRDMRRLFAGYYLLVLEDLGMPYTGTEPWLTGEEHDAAMAAVQRIRDDADWFREPDPDFASDNRYAVPVMTDVYARESRYWLVCGVSFVRLSVTYLRPPRIEVLDTQTGHSTEVPAGQEKRVGEYSTVDTRFVPAAYYLPIEVFAEANSSAMPLTREEFRTLCNGCSNVAEIREAMARRGSAARRWWTLAGLALVVAVTIFAWRQSRGGMMSEADASGTPALLARIRAGARRAWLHLMLIGLVLLGCGALLHWYHLRMEFLNAVMEKRNAAAVRLVERHGAWLGLNMRMAFAGRFDTPYGCAERFNGDAKLLEVMRSHGAHTDMMQMR